MEELLERLIVVLERIATQLENANINPDLYDYQQTYQYGPETRNGSVCQLRNDGWNLYRTGNDSDGDFVYYMRRPREYGA